MKCDACKEDFDECARRPKILPCGHTLCIGCARATEKCAVDDKEFENADALPDNFYIIELIATGHERRFFCITCDIPATKDCVENHDVRNLQNIRKKKVMPKLDAVKESVALHQLIVTSLVEMVPEVSDSFSRLVESATVRQEAQQKVLQDVQDALQPGGADGAWQLASERLDEAVRRAAEERPDLERQLALLESRALCHIELEAGTAARRRRIDATVNLGVESSVSRALRFVLYHLGTTGNLTVADEDEGSDLGSDWETADVAEEEEPQGAACLAVLRDAQAKPSTSRQAPSPTRVRRIARRRRPNRENYELLKALGEQDAVPNMEPFECPVCITDYAAGDGITLKECLHTFCRDCLQHTVEHSDKAEVPCPYKDAEYSCTNFLSQREIKALVPEDVFAAHLNRSILAAESAMDNTFHCKTVDCQGWCEFEPGVNQFVCMVCMVMNCLQCQVIHDPEDCATYQARIKRQAETDVEARQTQEHLDHMLATGNAMRCPKCAVIIMKRGGCDGLVCAMCKLAICWATKQARWGPAGSGDISGGCRCNVNGQRCHPNCGNCH